jgi:LacI family transcriptional regulator
MIWETFKTPQAEKAGDLSFPLLLVNLCRTKRPDLTRKKGTKVTVRDVAVAAGVSTATVSRVLSRDATLPDGRPVPVSAETRERVYAAAASLNYTMNHVARSLKKGSTRTIAILAPELSNDFFMELAEAMEKELGASGYMLLVSSSSNSAAEEERRLGVLAERLVDGIVVVPAASRGEHIQKIADRGTPVVLVDRLVEGAELDAVLADNEAGAFEAVGALLGEGYRRIAFVGGDVSLSNARERLAGFGRAMAGAGLAAGSEALRLGGMGIEDGYRLTDALLEEDDPPEALFAVNLMVHLGMERRLLEEGAEAFERVAVASFDETPYTPFMPACRYTVAQPAAEMGVAAARLILARVGAESPASARGRPEIIRLPTRVKRLERGRFSGRFEPKR